MSLIVTGSIGIDTIETPTGRVQDVLGGSVVYFAAAASFFGRVRLVGAAGEDFPDSLLTTLQHFDVDLAGLERRKGSKTFRWHGKYHANMNVRDTVKVDLNVLAERLPPVPPSYRDSEYVFLANTHPAGQMELLSQFKQRKIAVADTMDLWINNEKPMLLRLLAQIDGLVLNDSEAQLLTGETNIIKAADGVLKLGPKFVVVKKGEHGSLLRTKTDTVLLPAYPTTNVVDPTGAGDSFAGGMMGYLAAPGSASKGELSLAALRKAMALGTIVASFNIEAFSLNRLLQITRADLIKRLNDYRAMLDIGG